MRTALISDIHSNLEALQVVLSDVGSAGVDRVLCLGDVVGYGPNPRECIDSLGSCDLYILGNHDYALLEESYQEGFTPKARQALIWTRQALLHPSSPLLGNHIRELYGKFVDVHRENGVLYVHGSPRRPVEEYIFPGDITFSAKMGAIFSLIERVCFVGHTHLPGVFLEELAFISTQDVGEGFDLPTEQKVIVNIGSVGQPRDGNPAAGYVIFEQNGTGRGRVEFRRVPYDVEMTMAKIYRVQALHNDLGHRLAAGR